MNQGKSPVPWTDALWVGLTAFAARLAVVLWAAGRIVPTGDGQFYDTIAKRIASGQGYTWLWPDGVVTYAAHYPVGYPAWVGALYALFGPHPVGPMLGQALLGTAAALAAYALARRATTRKRALIAGLLGAVHIGLVAYTPALMTEGMTACLWIGAAYFVAKARECEGNRRLGWLLAMGLTLGLATLVRPQSLPLAVPFAWLTAGPGERLLVRVRALLVVTAVSLAVCAPWMVRNQMRMESAGLSFNGGWNLLIGATPEAAGTWAPLQVPEACRLVFDEAKKDHCFGQEALKLIGQKPLPWLSLVPKKLAITFDYCGAAGWYLHQSNPEAFSDRAKVRLGAAETIFERLVLLGALVGAGFAAGPRKKARLVLAFALSLFVFTQHAWVSYLGLVAVLALLGTVLLRGPVLPALTVSVLGLTALIHCAFFGAGRYSLVVFPFVTALASGFLTRAMLLGDTARPQGDTRHASD